MKTATIQSPFATSSGSPWATITALSMAPTPTSSWWLCASTWRTLTRISDSQTSVVQKNRRRGADQAFRLLFLPRFYKWFLNRTPCPPNFATTTKFKCLQASISRQRLCIQRYGRAVTLVNRPVNGVKFPRRSNPPASPVFTEEVYRHGENCRHFNWVHYPDCGNRLRRRLKHARSHSHANTGPDFPE